MGIKGLSALLQQNIEECFDDISIDDLIDKKIAIDINILLYI